MSLRLSATLLNSFHLYQTADWFKEEELIAQIKGEFKPTPRIEIGKAYHSLLERPQLTLDGVYERGGYRFAPSAIESLLERIDKRGLFEVKTTKQIGSTREDEDVVLVAKADHLYGLHLSEFKTTTDSFEPEKFLDSYQWRVMALLFQAQLITYHVACLDADDANIFQLRDLASMNVFPYDGLEADVRALVRELVRYLRIRHLDQFVRRGDEPKAVSA